MYENIYQFFRVCPGGGDAHVALLVLLPLIEIFLVFLAYRSVLMSTIATVKYFSVATAVEQVDNNIIGDIEQEKELEGDFQAAMVMQHNHLDRTIRDVTSIKKVKERVNSQLRLAQITWRHRVVRKNPKTGLDEDILTKTKELLADAESHIVDFLAHYDKTAAAASNKEGRESRYTSCSQTTSRNSGGDAGGDVSPRQGSTALSRVTSTGEVTEPPGRKSVAKTASLHERARLGIVQASKEHLELLGSDDDANDAKLLDPIPEPALPEPPTCDTHPLVRTNSSSPEAKRAYGRRTDKGWAYRGHAVDFREQVGKIKQYHAVVRMIHNPKTLDEDDIIQTFLVDAHLIFDGMPDNNTTNALRCDTLNSMGTHKQNRKLFADATDYFHKAMDIRTQKLASDAAGLAQACVSLGNNLVIAQEPAEKQLERCQEALPLLEKALHHYQAAFHQKHPKLSHAHEGIAECKLKLADLDGAQQHLDKAYEIKNHHRQGTEKLDNLANAIKEARREAQPKSVVSMIWKKPSIALAVSMTSLLGGERSPSASPTTERMPKNAAARWKMAKTGSLKLAKGVEAQPAGASPNSKRPSVFSMANDLASSISRSPRGERKRRASKEMASSTDAASPTGAASSTTDRQGSTDRV